jgi:nucleoside-diphosphate-sugar epimerase
MKIFVTGGGGFIGSHLIKRLLKNNHEITIFDNLSNCTKEHINSLGKVNFVNGDIRDFGLLKKSIRNHEFTIHLAAKTSVYESQENQENVIDVNVNGSENVIKSCIEWNIKNIIFISSAAVYGEGIKDKSLDERSQTKPISAYGKSKLEMENTVNEFSKTSDINSVIFRLFNVYGEGQSDVYAGVIKKFVEKSKQGNPVTIYGKGDQTRDFIHVNDVVEFIVKAMKKIEGIKGEVFNIGTGKTISIKQLAMEIFSIVKKNPIVNYVEPIQGDIKFSSTKIDKAKRILGYSPQVELKEGISKTFC